MPGIYHQFADVPKQGENAADTMSNGRRDRIRLESILPEAELKHTT